MNKLEIFAIIVLCISCMIIGSMATLLYQVYYPASKLNLNGEQINESVKSISYEMLGELKTFYRYNISELKSLYSEERLKEYGGVCRHASLWYIDEAFERGINGEYLRFGNNEISHGIAVVYNLDMSEYCILDQRQAPMCVKLNPNAGEPQ